MWNKSNIRVVVCFWSKWLTIWWVRSVFLCWQLSAECRKTQTPPSCYPDSVGTRFLWHTQAHSLICLLRAGHHNIDSWNHPHKSDTTQSEKIKHFCCNIKVSMIINSKTMSKISKVFNVQNGLFCIILIIKWWDFYHLLIILKRL